MSKSSEVLDFAMTFAFVCIHYDVAPHHLRGAIELCEILATSRSAKKKKEAEKELNDMLSTYHATLEVTDDDVVVVFNQYRLSAKQLLGGS